MEMEKVKVFLLGVIMTIGLMFLIGASHGQTGRYQIVDIGQDAYVLDTTTGDVYSHGYAKHQKVRPGRGTVFGMTKSYEITE